MLEAEGGLDPFALEPPVGAHQVVEAVVLERAVVHSRMRGLGLVVAQPGRHQEGDPVVGVVVGHPGIAWVHIGHAAANNDLIPIDHLLETHRLQSDVV